MEYILKNEINIENSPIEQIFFNRGLDYEDMHHYLYTNDTDILDPQLLDRVKDGAIMLLKHIKNNDKIMVQVDSDCDGFTSAAILINYINCIFPSCAQNNIYYRMHEGKEHGIILDTIPEGIKLVIAPDSSSNDYEIHKALAAAGIDVLVLDHHEADRVSEYACVINNQLCNYPTKSLSGAGVVYKFCQYIDKIIGTNHADLFLDLAAIGIIGDLMDVRSFEVRQIIIRGLRNIRNPLIYEICNRQSYSIEKHGQLDNYAVSFYIVPLINAIVRSGTMDEKLTVFKAMLDFCGYQQVPSTKRGCSGQLESLVEQAVRICTNVKSRQTKSNTATLEYITTLIENNNLLNNKILLIQLDDDVIDNKNLTGLVANQLASKYQHPTLILNKRVNPETQAITWEGSGRNYSNSRIQSFKDFLLDTDLVMYAQGHGNAFGCGITDENLNKFIEKTNNLLKDYIFTPCYYVDFIFTNNNFAEKDILDIAALNSIWGTNLEEPLIAIQNIPVVKDKIRFYQKEKSSTLVIDLTNGVSLIHFNSSQEEYDKLSEQECIYIDVVGKCKANNFMGRTTAQIEIVDFEIVGCQDFYF